MRRVLLGIGIILLLPLALIAIQWQTLRTNARVPLSDDRELRILKVSLGTNHTYSAESFWKQSLRRVIPKTWQKFMGPAGEQKFLTRNESLVIWVEKVSRLTGNLAMPRPGRFEARLPDGSFVEGDTQPLAGGITGWVEFRRFARTAREVPLQYHDGTNVVSFVVDNPRPARTAQWTAKPLPQTNQVSQTKIVLYESRVYNHMSGTPDYFQIRINARAPDDGRTGWVYWRVIGFDSSGNWSEPSWDRSSRLPFRLPMLSVHDAPWKLCVEAEEYISAGFLPSPTNESYVACPLDVRAQSLGVIFLMVADRGSYFVTNGIVTRQNEHAINAPYPPPSITWSSKANWTLQVVTEKPGIICLSDGAAGFPGIRARLRERLPHNEGRIFAAHPSTVIHIPLALNLTLGLFPIALPTGTTNLEAEVIVMHPPAEFFIEPPK